MRAILLALLLAAPATVGCLAGDDPATPDAAGVEENPDDGLEAPPTVVAVPDSGINPYHEAFQGGPSVAEVPGFPADATRLNLTREAGSYGDAVEADAEAWEDLEEGELVWFPGTRLAGISLDGSYHNGPIPEPAPEPVDDDVEDPRFRLLDEDGHGTLTAHSVLAAAPDAVVVAVQIPDDENLTTAMAWIAQQGWIDLVSVSWGTWSMEYADDEARMGLPEAYREAYASGTLIFNGAGNEPIPHGVSEHPGPPFVIGVGGSQPETRGETEIAAKTPDIVAPFTQERAEEDSLDEYTTASGTSLSTPYAVGAVAQALHGVREALDISTTGADPLVEAEGPGMLEDGELAREELWDAMNRSAEQWGPTDWQPSTAPSGVGYGLPVAHPAVQQGWGHVGPNVTDRLTGLVLGEADPAEKAPGTEAFVDARVDAQRAFWASPAGEEPPVPDPGTG